MTPMGHQNVLERKYIFSKEFFFKLEQIKYKIYFAYDFFYFTIFTISLLEKVIYFPVRKLENTEKNIKLILVLR